MTIAAAVVDVMQRLGAGHQAGQRLGPIAVLARLLVAVVSSTYGRGGGAATWQGRKGGGTAKAGQRAGRTIITGEHVSIEETTMGRGRGGQLMVPGAAVGLAARGMLHPQRLPQLVSREAVGHGGGRAVEGEEGGTGGPRG